MEFIVAASGDVDAARGGLDVAEAVGETLEVYRYSIQFFSHGVTS